MVDPACRVCAPADSRGLLLGNRDEPLSGLGNVQAGKVAEFLLEMKVGASTVQQLVGTPCVTRAV